MVNIVRTVEEKRRTAKTQRAQSSQRFMRFKKPPRHGVPIPGAHKTPRFIGFASRLAYSINPWRLGGFFRLIGCIPASLYNKALAYFALFASLRFVP